MLERDPLADLWKHTLSRIPSFYGRLIYLTSLRDPNSGFYRHHGLSLAFGREESGRALRESHERAFLEWLQLPLPQKNSDIASYLADLEEGGAGVAATWFRTGYYRNLIPDRATRAQKEHFLQESEVLLEILRNAGAAAGKSPDSVPRA